MSIYRTILKQVINRFGYDISRLPLDYYQSDSTYMEVAKLYLRELKCSGLERVHYGCGGTFMPGWANVDRAPLEALTVPRDCVYFAANLIDRHPFPDGCFRFAFAEDFLEHIDQAESLLFLAEVFRTLQIDGVLRLSFPGLEGVLARHYQPANFTTAFLALDEAYRRWGHKHFYSRGELETVAKHYGFRKIEFVAFGESSHPELVGLDSRSDQKDLNLYVELTK